MNDRCHGMLHLGALEVPFLAVGRGRPLLLLAGGDVRSLAGLIDRLAGNGHRVILPLLPLPPGAEELEDLVLGIVEGLGLDRPAVLADPMAEGPLRVLVERHPDRLGPLEVGPGSGVGPEGSGAVGAPVLPPHVHAPCTPDSP